VADGPTPQFALRFRATADGARPLANVTVAIAGRRAGATDAGGSLQVNWRAQEGTSLPLSTSCPPGYRSANAPRSITLRRSRGLDRQRAPALQVTIDCVPSEHTAVLVVRAPDRPDLPVIVDGRERGRTDRSGVAHVYLRREPYRVIQVTLDTRARARLRPQNPSITFRLENSDAIFVFDQPFELVPARRRRRRHRRPEPPREVAKPPEPVRPIRIE
jgi:hypothetical protein